MQPATNPVGPDRDEVLDFITEAIRNVSAQARTRAVTPGSLLFEDLGLDSLDLVALVLKIQDHFELEIEPDEIPSMRCVNDLAAILSKHLRKAA
jgi:acyl carrier protein